MKQIDSEKKLDRLKLCKLLKTIYSNNTTEEINFISNQLLQILDNFSEKSAYEEISNKGGGISSSIVGVKNASESLLVSRVKSRMDKFLSLGTTTVECKSGYGLDTKTELKSLKVIYEVNKMHEIDMIPTFMGAHDFPKEFINDKDSYVDIICDEMIPEVASQGIAKFNDVFCENGYFNIEQSKKILNVGRRYGLHPRMHADELYESGAANLAADLKVSSTNHLM